jgi:hypothetical protein
MKFTISTIALVAASSVAALPARRADGPSDTDILNYALTLGMCAFYISRAWAKLLFSLSEHLENAFYKEALGKYDASAFEAAGYKSFVRGRFQQVCSSVSFQAFSPLHVFLDCGS